METIFGNQQEQGFLRYQPGKSKRANSENLHPNAVLPKPKPKPKKKKVMEPIRILDAPGLEDDFCLNLLDWSHDNFVAIAL